jgi:zinc transporter 2
MDSIVSRDENSPSFKANDNPLGDSNNHNHNHNHGGDIETPSQLMNGFGVPKTAHEHDHGHGHEGHNHGHEGHNHGDGGECGGHHHHKHEETNINIRAAVVHVIGDMLQSIGVIIAALAIYLYP